MIQVFGSLKGLLKSKRTRIDYAMFRLHYQFTVLLLLVFCIIVTTKQYGGEPIKCTKNSKEFSEVADAYCLITTTFTAKSAYNISLAGKIPYPGIRQPVDSSDFRYHRYYQWVGFVLFLQAVSFYFPHWLWKTLEGNKVHWLLSGIDAKYFAKDEMELRRDMILQYLHRSWGNYNLYATKYILCEFLCFVNIVIQMCALNRMFDGDFLSYGVEVVKYLSSDNANMPDPMVKVFPRVTSCSFRYFGETGKIDEVHLLCILSVNVINEKIYIFLWFWFVTLGIVSSWSVFFRISTYIIRPVRAKMMQARFRHMNSDQIRILIQRGGFGDWFLLHLIGQNVDDVHFINFVSDLSDKMSEKKPA